MASKSDGLKGELRSRKAPQNGGNSQAPLPCTPLRMKKMDGVTIVEAEEMDVNKVMNTFSSPFVSPCVTKNPRKKPWHPQLMRASTDLHLSSQPSMLSMGAHKQDFRGFMNLAAIALIFMNLRLVLENILKYGILFSLRGDVSRNWDKSWPALLTAVLVSVLSPTLTWLIEASRYRFKLSTSTTSFFHVLLVVVMFSVPLSLIWFTDAAIGSAFVLAFVCVISTMKLISYGHVSTDIAKLGGNVIRFSHGPIVALEPGTDPTTLAADVYQCAFNDHVALLRRIQTDAMVKLARFQLGDADASIAHVQSPVVFVAASDVMESGKAQDEDDSNSNLSGSWGFDRAVHQKAALTPIYSTRLMAGVSAVYSVDKDDSSGTITIELLDLPPAPERMTFTIKPYEPSFFHAVYYFLAPTLVFQLSYPRTPRVRLGFVLRRFLELIFVSVVLLFMADQYVRPTLTNSIAHIQSGAILPLLERVLKLAVPNLVMWLLIFYAIFHSYLNLLAELLRFGDRLFYRDWWNSADMGEYWRLWNRPVHDWLAKHIYCVATRHGVSSNVAKLLVFLVSALLHEVLISIPCHMVGYYAFLGMLAQVPSVYFSQLLNKIVKNPVIGNVMFWCTLPLIGQPVLILLYWYQYFQTHGLGA